MVQAEAAERFLSAPMLADVDPRSRLAVLGSLVEVRRAVGSVLLVQGQPNDHLTFLIGGTAAIERKRGDAPAEILATLTAPSVFGMTTFFRMNSPTFTVRATSEVWLLTLYHPAHDKLRKKDPEAAEELALAALRILCERFDDLDRMYSDYMAHHPDDRSKANEWAGFRSRLFEEPPD